MNLYDLLARGDRMVDAPRAGVSACVLKLPAGTQRAVHLEDGAMLRLRGAHEATALRAFPSSLDWRCHLGPGASLAVWIETAGGDRHRLADVAAPPAVKPPEPARGRWWPRSAITPLPAAPGTSSRDVTLDWPLPVPPAFDLCLEPKGGGVDLAVGALFDGRLRLLPMLRGHGIEIGPGLHPAVRPDATRTVKYVEKCTPVQWEAMYAKQGLDTDQRALWDDYIVDSAERLDSFDDASLDFVFSSHVVEHLVNPVGALETWWSKLRQGGVIAGIVPDARYTFDLRQPLTTLDELMAQHRDGLDRPTAAMYARWCRYTAVDSRPGSLAERDYAIHVNYFSPMVFRALLDALAELSGGTAGVFIESVPNGKDFGFAVVKP
ncbi:methyltransferase domain-containing protein [Lysobacter xanthus]